MTTFSVSGATGGVSFAGFDIDNWDTATVNSQTSTFWQITPSGQPTWSFTGSGLTYDANGFPTAGTITFIQVVTPTGTLNFNLNATPASAAALVAAIVANDEAAFFGLIFAGNDVINATAFNDLLYGYGGHDNMRGGLGQDVLYGGVGDDIMAGGVNTNTNLGDADGADTLYGEAGNDVLRGANGDDALYGGDDNDNLAGNDGDDTIDGGAQNDTLVGGAGSDVLNGGLGFDRLYGEAGNDTLTGGLDSSDQFIWQGNTNLGSDTVTDFQNGVDKIRLLGTGATQFSDLTIGQDGSGNATITLANGTVITLQGTAQADVDASDFLWI